MSKPLPTQNTFANVAPSWSLPQLDANFTNVFAAINDFGTYTNTLIDTGAVNALVATAPVGTTFTLATGLTFDITVANTTTSASPSLNVNALGGKTITTLEGAPLPIGALLAGATYRVVYDGTFFRVQTFVGRLNGYKASATSRANNATVTGDPDLQIVLSATGNFVFQGKIYRSDNSAGGLQFVLNYTGTTTNNAWGALGRAGGTITSFAAQSLGTTGFTWNNTIGPDLVDVFGTFTTTTTGTLAFLWAQNTTNATATTIAAGSSLFVERV